MPAPSAEIETLLRSIKAFDAAYTTVWRQWGSLGNLQTNITAIEDALTHALKDSLYAERMRVLFPPEAPVPTHPDNDPPAYLCEHANEVPQVCPCDSTCDCKTHTCRPR